MCNKTIDILIMYEIKPREIDCISLIRNELIRRGYSVEVLCFAERINPRRFKRFKNRVKAVLMPSLYDTEELLQQVYYAAGKVEYVFNLQWEQVYTIACENDLNSSNYPKGEARKAIHICWGEAESDNLKRSGVPENNIRIAGAVHLDFYRKEFLSKRVPKKDLFSRNGLELDAETVLFISSFSSKAIDEISKKPKIDEKSEDPLVSSYLGILKWIDKLLFLNPELVLIYRPHPVECKNSHLFDLANKHQNFRVISDGTIKDWIVSCDRVATWVSTSIVEAYYANISCLILRPCKLNDSIEMATYRNARFVTSEDDFLRSFSTSSSQSVDAEVIAKYYSIGHRYSYLRVADIVDEAFQNLNVFQWDLQITSAFDKRRPALTAKLWVYSVCIWLMGLGSFLIKQMNLKISGRIAQEIDNRYDKWVSNIASQSELQSKYKYWDIV